VKGVRWKIRLVEYSLREVTALCGSTEKEKDGKVESEPGSQSPF